MTVQKIHVATGSACIHKVIRVKPLNSVWMSRLGEAGMWLMVVQYSNWSSVSGPVGGQQGDPVHLWCDSVLSLRKGPVGT